MTNTEQNTEQVVNAVSDVSNGINWELTIAVIALVIAIIAILLAVFFYLKLKWYTTDNSIEDNYGHKPRHIKDLIVAQVVNSSRIDNYIMGKYREAIAASRLHSQNSNGEISTMMYNDIVENVVRQVEKRMSHNTISHQPNAAMHTANGNAQKLYATSYNASNETFYEVNRQPSEQTIFEITINPNNPNEGKFEVYRNAYEMVAECKDFLEYCCEVEGSGISLQTIETGQVTLNEGVWVVTKKLKVRFS